MKRKATIEEIKLFTVGEKRKKTPEEINDTRTSRLTDDMVSENMATLNMCKQYWDALADFRDRRRKNRKYYRGDQWHETIEDEDNPGEYITEEEHILNRGKIPFKQNVIRQLVRNLIGQYRTNKSKTVVVARKRGDAKLSEMLTNALNSVQDLNKTSELDARNFEEYLLSGMILAKSKYDYFKNKNREDVFTTNVNPNRIFFNDDVSDIRGTDIRVIGEIIDVPLDTILTTFARNLEEEKKIRGWYSNVSKKGTVMTSDGLSPDIVDNMDFYTPFGNTLARVIEVWELTSDIRVYAHDRLDGTYTVTSVSTEELDAINQERIQMGIENGVPEEQIALIEYEVRREQFWTYKFLTPYGNCLLQGETTYEHEEHPYTIKLYPLLDGEVWGLVEDIIDQQRYINRLVSLIDFIMGSAAKGVLFVHEDSIPDDMDIEDFADEWTKYNGVVKFKGKPGVPLPQQVSANITNIGAQDLLAMQMRLVQEIAGVGNAIQGKTAKSGTPSSLYAQEAINSTTNSRDMFDFFTWFKEDRDTKLMRLIMQYYKEPRMVAISGKRYAEEAGMYDPELVRNVEFSLKVTQGIDSPVYRQIIDDQLMMLFDKQAITIQEYLENSSLPYADKLLESIAQRQQQQPGGGEIPPELQQQINGQASPDAMAMIGQLMGKGNAA